MHGARGLQRMNVERPITLLVVEDDEALRSLLCEELCELGLRIVEARDGHEALERVDEQMPDIVLTDLRMPGGGLKYIFRLRTKAPASPIILMTGFGDTQTKAQALELGVAACFDKPVHVSALKSAVRELLGMDSGISP